MPVKMPTDKRDMIRERIYARLDAANYLNSSRTENAVLLEDLCSDPEIGGIIGEFCPKERIRTYIKDAVLNRYAKEHKKEVAQNVEPIIISSFGKSSPKLITNS